MTKHLDPRFAKVVARMRSTTFDGERNAARVQAGKVAESCGLSYDEALQIHDAPPAAPKPASFFDGFDDWMEQKEPGWTAKRADEKANRLRAWAERKAAIIARFGSEEAAWAPCWREKLILKAVAPWREANEHEGAFHQRWTVALDGWKGAGFEWRSAPPHVIEAIRTAYPLPATFADAKAEWDYWDARNQEMEDVLSEDGQWLGDGALDRAADMRANMVRDLAEKDIPVITLVDLHARFAMMMASDIDEPEIEKALFRDLSAMVDTQARGPRPGRPIRSNRIGQIEAALRSDPSSTDRRIAQALGCSPTTVGKTWRELGLDAELRTVHRRGQVYGMKAPASQSEPL